MCYHFLKFMCLFYGLWTGRKAKFFFRILFFVFSHPDPKPSTSPFILIYVSLTM